MSIYKDKFNDLWGSVVKEINIFFEKSEIIMHIEITKNEKVSQNTLVFKQVTQINYSNKLIEPWSYIELTGINVARKNNSLYIEIEFWSSAIIDITCGEIVLNDIYLE